MMNSKKRLLLESIKNIIQHDIDSYVNDQQLSIPPDMEDLIVLVNDIVKTAPVCCREEENLIQEMIASEEYVKIKEFLQWLQQYVDSINKPFEMYTFLQEYSVEEFENISIYCLEKFILNVTGQEELEKDGYKLKEIQKIKSAILHIANLKLCKYYSNKLAYEEAAKLFGMNTEQCDIWLEIISDNADRLWKFLLMQKLERIDEQLNLLGSYI